MNKWLTGGLVLFTVTAVIVAADLRRAPETNPTPETQVETNTPEPVTSVEATPEPATAQRTTQSPMDRAAERVTKITFGLYVSPTNSPIQPQRFTGYHTGWDFEIFPDELNKEVTVTAFCTGNLRLKQIADGYGGVVVQECKIDNVEMTVIYGHIKLNSITTPIGGELKIGEKVGVLGANRSSETDGERKHLHFDLHRGTAINIRGYVGAESLLIDWIDPKTYLPL